MSSHEAQATCPLVQGSRNGSLPQKQVEMGSWPAQDGLSAWTSWPAKLGVCRQTTQAPTWLPVSMETSLKLSLDFAYT